MKHRFDSAETRAAALPAAMAHVAGDGVICYPTETVYGLGGRVTGAAIAAIEALKGREPGKPLLLLVAGLSMASRLGLEVKVEAARLAGAFWPGPLTMVLPPGDSILPAEAHGANGGVAIRQSSHPGAAELVAALDGPLISTSANRSGRAPLSDPAGVEGEFGPAGDKLLVLDAGPLPASQPSTIVDLCGRAPALVREGAISWSEVRRALSR